MGGELRPPAPPTGGSAPGPGRFWIDTLVGTGLHQRHILQSQATLLPYAGKQRSLALENMPLMLTNSDWGVSILERPGPGVGAPGMSGDAGGWRGKAPRLKK